MKNLIVLCLTLTLFPLGTAWTAPQKTTSQLQQSKKKSVSKASAAVSVGPVSFGKDCPAELQGPGQNVPMPAGRGMDAPWEEIQAEDAETNAQVLGPCRMKWSYDHLEAEAIGRKAVVLLKEGDYVRFKPKQAHNSIVVRYSVPDAAAGGGDKYTLGLFVNGKKATSLELSSLYSWNYKGQLLGDPSTDTPAESPHTFYDEARFLFPETHKGDTIELRREGGDKAGFYVIDLADFEAVPPPVPKPEGFVDVRDYGINPDDGLDHAADLEFLLRINPNINADPLHNERKLYFPPGTYIIQDFKAGVTKKDPSEEEKTPLNNEGLDCNDCEIRGAGMWHTRLTGRRAMFFCLAQVSGNVNTGGCHYQDFSITGVTKTRSEEKEGPQKAFAGPQGSQSTIDHVWIEHVVAGIWVGNDPPDQARATENLQITNCRIRNTFADGINFANGTSNSSVENCHIRSTGDDGIAVWSVNWPDWVKENPTLQFKDPNAPGQGVGHGNHFNKVSVQMPWRANCFAVYGGNANTFENSTCEDVLTYPGIFVDNEFSPYPFGPDVTTFRNITLNRAGGTMFFEGTPDVWNHAALEFYTREGDVNDILVQDVDIIAPTFAGISFKGFGTKYVIADPAHGLDHPPPSILADADKAKIQNVTLNNVKVTSPGTASVELLYGAGVGKVDLQNVRISKPYMKNNTPSDLGAFFAGPFLEPEGAPLDIHQIGVSSGSDIAKRAPSPGGHRPATWNMQGGRDRWAGVYSLASAYDIVALQEVPAAVPAAATRLADINPPPGVGGTPILHYSWQEGGRGHLVHLYILPTASKNLGMVTQQPMNQAFEIAGNYRPILAVVDAPNNVMFGSIHASSNGPNNNNDAVSLLRRAETAAINNHIANWAVLGDFNQAPERLRSRTNPSIPNSARIYNPGQATQQNGGELDYLVSNIDTEDWAATVLRNMGSDHWPVGMSSMRASAGPQEVTLRPDGYSKPTDGAGKVLEVAGTRAGAVVYYDDFSSSPPSGLNQTWLASQISTGRYRFRISADGPCLDIHGTPLPVPGSGLMISDCHSITTGPDTQVFILERDPIQINRVRLRSSASGDQYVSARGRSATSGGGVVELETNDANNFREYFYINPTFAPVDSATVATVPMPSRQPKAR